MIDMKEGGQERSPGWTLKLLAGLPCIKRAAAKKQVLERSARGSLGCGSSLLIAVVGVKMLDLLGLRRNLEGCDEAARRLALQHHDAPRVWLQPLSWQQTTSCTVFLNFHAALDVFPSSKSRLGGKGLPCC